MCEVSSKTDFDRHIVVGEEYINTDCHFKMDKNNKRLSGSWSNNKTKLDIALTSTSSMTKDNIDSKNGELEIPFWGQTDSHTFIGIYEKNDQGIVIRKINVVHKQTGQITQVIEPQDNYCEFGFYMTPIYQNVENLSNSEVSLNCYSTDKNVTVEYRKVDEQYIKMHQ